MATAAGTMDVDEWAANSEASLAGRQGVREPEADDEEEERSCQWEAEPAVAGKLADARQRSKTEPSIADAAAVAALLPAAAVVAVVAVVLPFFLILCSLSLLLFLASACCLSAVAFAAAAASALSR